MQKDHIVAKLPVSAAQQEQYLASIMLGMSKNAASRAAGVPERVMKDFLTQGRLDLEDAKPDTPEARFFTASLMAEAKVDLTLTESVMAEAQNDGKVALDVLARRHPDEWGRKERVQLEGDEAAPVVIKTVTVQQMAARDDENLEVGPDGEN